MDDRNEFEENVELPNSNYQNKGDCYAASTFGGIGDFMRHKRAKLRIQNDAAKSAEPDLPQIFKGLAIYINGFTGPDITLIQLSQLLVLHGGIYVSYLDKKSLVTHIIASNLTPSKRVEFKDYKVAVPAWLTSSIKAGKLLNYKLFLETSGVYQHQEGIGQLDSDRLGTQTNQRGLFTMAGWKEEIEIPSFQPSRLQPSSPAKLPQAEWDSYLPTKRSDRSCLNDPAWIALHTASHPNYLANYLANSRLHHLSTWKQDLITYAASAQASRPPLKKSAGQRTIFHVDFDSFFVAVGLISRPHLRGKCIAVCHAKGDTGGETGGVGMEESTSEISSCSYEARKFGVKSSMSLGKARELCPDIITIPFEFDLYQSISRQFYDVLLSHADYLQAVSVDEVLMDVSSQFPLDSLISPRILAERIRKEIEELTGCTVSIGIGHNILLAKLATRKAKPNGSFHLNSSIKEHLKELNLEDLPGIGSNIAYLAQEHSIQKVGDLLAFRPSKLVEIFGKVNGPLFLNYANGIDTREIEILKERKSVGCDVNYGIRFQSNSQVQIFVNQIGEEVAKRLKSLSLTTRLVTLKIFTRHSTAPKEAPKFLGHGLVDKVSFSVSVATEGNKSTDSGQIIGVAAWKLLLKAKLDPTELRGIGIHCTNLEMNGIGVGLKNKLEIGQGRLDFSAVKPVIIQAKQMERVMVETELELPTAGQSRKRKVVEEVDLIISSDSDEGASLPVKRSSRNQTKIVPLKKIKKPKLATIFKSSSVAPFILPSASEISEEYLTILEIDFLHFKKLSKFQQNSILNKLDKQAINNLKSYLLNQQSQSQSTLPPAMKSTKSFQSIPLKPPPPPPLPSSSPLDSSPTTMSQSDLFKLNPTADFNTFKELSLKEQRKQIKVFKSILKTRKSLKVISIKPMIKSYDLDLPRIIQIQITPPANFRGVILKEGLRLELEEWIEGAKEEEREIELRELREWKEFFGKISKFGKEVMQRDLKLCEDLIEWWEFLLELEFGREGGEKWWEGWRSVKISIGL